MIESFDNNRPLLLRTMNGIGDACWFLAMIASGKESFGVKQIIVKVQEVGDHRDGRAIDFLKRFDFLDFVFSERFELRGKPAVKDNRIQYVTTGYNADRSQYTLIPNAFIEWGERLESLMPSLPCDWSFLASHYAQDESGVEMSKSLRRSGTLFGGRARGYICVHPGSPETRFGMNIGNVWTPRHWVELLTRIREESSLPICFLGAGYDRALSEEIVRACRDLPNLTNLCGQTSPTQAIEILRHASLLVAFPSGLPIAATYMGTPTVGFWNPEGRSVSPSENYWFSDSFATNWVPPGAPYRAAVYGRDDCESVFSKIREVLS